MKYQPIDDNTHLIIFNIWMAATLVLVAEDSWFAVFSGLLALTEAVQMVASSERQRRAAKETGVE